jgi:TerC family integral membrane protein
MDIFQRFGTGSRSGGGGGSSLLPSVSGDRSSGDLEPQSFKAAIFNTLAVVICAAIFGVITYFWKGEPAAVEFLTGYLVEQSLSIDNLFVFIMLFEYFKVPLQYQSRVLTWGIIGAVIMRGFMIVVGVAAIERFKIITLIFAAILVISAYKLLKESNDNDEEDLSKNFILKLSKYIIKSSPNYDGDRFFTRENGQTLATPLLMCLVCIEISDVVFAIDSIPAVLGVSHDPFVVYTSNIFAIMGLRSLYTVVSKAMKHMHYLKPAVGMFVYIHMCNTYIPSPYILIYK